MEDQQASAFPRTVSAVITVRSATAHPARMITPELKAVLGPLADSLPRAAVVVVSGLLALVLADIAGGAFRRGGPLSFLMAWLLAACCVIAGCLAFRSLAQFGVRRSLLEPLSLGGIAAFASAERIPIAGAVTAGVLIAGALWRRTRARDVSAASVLTEEPDRAAAIGALGEALVAGEVSALGWPVLRNVILLDGAHSMEIDLLVRVSDGLLVLEAKTWSGFISGSEDGPMWTQHRKGGRIGTFRNPARQNFVRVRAVERFVADPTVWVRGFVVSAGHAEFAAQIARTIVPLANLRTVLRHHVAIPLVGQSAIDVAWSRLAAEATRSERRRSVHAAYVRSRKGAFVDRW
jgi:hypothetical protein